MEEMNPFFDYEPSFLPFGGVDSISDSSASTMVGEPCLFPPNLQGDEPLEDTGSIFISEPPSDDVSVLTGEVDSPPQQSLSFGTSSPASTASDDSSFIKPEPAQQEQFFYGSPGVAPAVMQKNDIMIPEQKKRRRASEQPKPRVVGKKRKAQKDSVVMDFDELQSKSSVELETMLRTLSSQGSLRADDEKNLRRIKRKVKNRESAQISRIRHRDHVGLIEAELEYQKMVSAKLREYADKCKQAMIENNVAPPPEPEIPEFVPPAPSDLSLIEPSRTIMRPLRTAGFCLMMFVLSLGVVFNVMHHMEHDSNSSLVPVSSTTTSATTEPSGAVIVEPTAPLNQLPPATKTTTATTTEPVHAPDSTDVIRRSTYLSLNTDKEDSSLALVITSTKEQQIPGDALVPRSASAVMPYTTKTIFGTAKPRLADRSWSLDNTSYILVNDASEFVPRSVDLNRLEARTEPVIGLLIPASSFNIPNLAPDDVVELVCNVRNATLVPHNVLARTLY